MFNNYQSIDGQSINKITLKIHKMWNSIQKVGYIYQITPKRKTLNKIKKIFPLLFFILFTYTIHASAHNENGSGILNTGDNLGATGAIIYLIIGIGLFVLILLSAIWLLTREIKQNDSPKTYLDKIKMFGRNARLYILHIQGMSLTYGVRSIVLNIYLLFIFREGVHLFGYEINPIFFIGILLATGSLISGIISPFSGIIVDKIGKKWSFIMGDFTGSITILLIIFFQSPEFVIATQIVRSAVMSIHSIAEGPYIYEQSTRTERVHLFSVSSGMSTLASMSGNLTGGVVPLTIALIFFKTAVVSGLKSIFVLQAALFVSVVMWWLSLIPALPLTENMEMKQKANQHSVSARLSFKNVTNWKTIWIFVISSVFIGTGAGLFVNFFDIFFFVYFHATPAEISMIFAIGAILVAIGNFLTPILSDKYGKVNLIVSTRFISIIFIVLIPLAPFLLLAGVFYLLRVFFMVGSFPTESALAMETVNDEERTTMESLRIGGSAFFSALGFAVGSYFMSINDFVTPFIYASVLYLIATTVFWLYFKGGKEYTLSNEVKLQASKTSVVSAD